MTENQSEKNLRLLEVRKALGLRQLEMAELLGINRGNLSNIEKCKEGRNVPKDAKFILEKEKGVNPEWFDTGKGPMFLNKGIDETDIRFMMVKDQAAQNDKTTLEQKLISTLEKNQEVYEKALKATEEAKLAEREAKLAEREKAELLKQIIQLKDKINENAQFQKYR